MESSFLKNKNQNYKFTEPWDHYVIDQFLPPREFAKFQRSLCSVTDGYQKRDNDIFALNFTFLPDLALAKFFLCDDFRKFLENITQTKLRIYEKGLVQLRMMTPESPAFEPHVDDQDERSLVCLWYLSPDWHSDKGGELNLLKNKDISPEDQSSKILAPLANRMVLFFSDDHHWHSVNKVYNWNRYSVISEWIVVGV